MVVVVVMQGWWTVLTQCQITAQLTGGPRSTVQIFLWFWNKNPVASERLYLSCFQHFGITSHWCWNNFFYFGIIFCDWILFVKNCENTVSGFQYFGQHFACDLLHNLNRFCFLVPYYFHFLVQWNLYQTLINLHHHPTHPCSAPQCLWIVNFFPH